MRKLKKSKTLKIKSAHKEKLLELAKIFNEALPMNKQANLPEIDYCTPPRVKPTTKPPRVKPTTEPQRVEQQPKPVSNDDFNKLNKPTGSLQPTSPVAVLQAPITHQQSTRNNTPAYIPTDNGNVNPPPPPLRRSQQTHVRTPAYILQQAINRLTTIANQNSQQFTPRRLMKYQALTYMPSCNAVVHPVTRETITKY